VIRSIGSANGLKACALAVERIGAGSDLLDAVVAGIGLVEDDPKDRTVGYGGLPNENGIVELDAAVMDGRRHRAGAVAGLRNVRHASKVAQLVMQQTNHVLLAGEGALAFARANGFAEENLLTEESRKIWLHWKRTHSDLDDWLPAPLDQADPAVREFFRHVDDHDPGGRPASYARSEADREPSIPAPGNRPTGTVHCAAVDGGGDVACCTSTSGLAFKISGRVGDSPLIGAGLYADNEVGTCGSTGRGECNVQHASSAVAVELMRQGLSPEEAGLEVLQRIVRNTGEAHLLRADGRPNFGLKLYLLRKDGSHAGVSIWGPAVYAVADERGARLEPCAHLFARAV
jgi:N4-(beta-N-acetylglucosaminyl)-L-asparaginase